MGWSGDAMVLGKLPLPRRPAKSIIRGQGRTALAVGEDGVIWTFFLSSRIFLFSLSLFPKDGLI